MSDKQAAARRRAVHQRRLELAIGQVTLCVASAGHVYARQDEQTPSQPDWELTGPSGPVLQLFTPTSSAFLARTQTGLMRSDGGGATWSELGRQDIGTVNDIAVGVEGQNLYAATDSGVWRLHRGS